MSLKEETISEFTILNVRRSREINYDTDLKWLCRSFGFLSSRDKQETAYTIFKVILEISSHKEGLTSDSLAEKIGLSRGAMIHHLNKLIKSGLIIHQGSNYKLRGKSLLNTIQEIQKDIDRIFDNIIEVCKSIDLNLGLYFR
jgi:biotin operon repressor